MLKYSDSLQQMVKIVYPSNIQLNNMVILGDEKLPDFLFTQKNIVVSIEEPFSPDAFETIKDRAIVQRRKYSLYLQARDERNAYRKKYLSSKTDTPFY